MKRLIFVFIYLLFLSSHAFAGHPLITDDTDTQGRGSLQVEMGISHFYDKFKEDEQTTCKTKGGEAGLQLTIGLIDTVDIVAGLPYQWCDIKENDIHVAREKGISDITLELKWRFFEKNGWALAIKPGIILPAGNEKKGLGAGRVGGSFFLIGSKEFEPLTFHVNVGYTRNENKLDERIDLWHLSAAAEIEIIRNLKLMGDIGLARNPDPESNNHPAFVLAGISYDFFEWLTIDAGIKRGLTATEPDWTGLAGITVHF